MRQAMIFAAGLGTRLRPLTDNMPKALVRVGGEPLLRHVVLRLKGAGFERIVVNVHHFAGQIVSYLEQQDNFGMDIRISDESERLLDTGGGIRKALPLFDPSSPVLIHNVDILSNADLPALYDAVDQERDGGALLVSQRDTKRYLLFNGQQQLKAWTNIATGEMRGSGLDIQAVREGSLTLTPLAFSGIHVLTPRVFPLLACEEERFSIIDFYLRHCREVPFVGYRQAGLQLLDVGKLDSLEQAGQFIIRNS